MRFLSLFAGIGGFDLGLEWAGMESAGQVEIDPYCLAVLKKHWPNVKRMGDIHNVKGNEFGTIDLVSGGVPCQPASAAGKRKGTKDDRWLWPETFRIVRAVQPAWCLFENVRGITSLQSGMVFDSLLSELENIGYEVQPFNIPACGVNAPHRRQRIWILAHAEGQPQRSGLCPDESATQRRGRFGYGGSADIADTSTAGLSQPKQETLQEKRGRQKRGTVAKCNWWSVEPGMGRVVHGVPARVDRIKCLGNAVVPQIVEEIGKAIIETENKINADRF